MDEMVRFVTTRIAVGWLGLGLVAMVVAAWVGRPARQTRAQDASAAELRRVA